MAQSLVHGLQLLEDIHFFLGANEKLLAKCLQWHTIVVTRLLTLLPFIMKCVYSLFPLHLWLSCNQATQLTHLIDGRLREAIEDAEHEKALKDVIEATTKD